MTAASASHTPSTRASLLGLAGFAAAVTAAALVGVLSSTSTAAEYAALVMMVDAFTEALALIGFVAPLVYGT